MLLLLLLLLLQSVKSWLVQMQCAICILSLDFRTAFGNALHYYLCHIIIEHDFDDTSIKILCSPYKNVTSISGVNGFLSEKFPTERTLTEDLFTIWKQPVHTNNHLYPSPAKRCSSTSPLMIPRSNRRIEMRKLCTINNSAKKPPRWY